METDISGEVRVVVAAVGILHPDSLIYRNLLSLNPFYERPGVWGGLEVRWMLMRESFGNCEDGGRGLWSPQHSSDVCLDSQRSWLVNRRTGTYLA